MITVEDPLLQGKIEQIYEESQEHIFRFWDRLNPESRKQLLEQLRGLDFDLLNHFILLSRESVSDEKYDLQPAPVITLQERKKKDAEALAAGEDHLRRGKMAAFLVAGGQGTRLGYEGPKGVFPVTPVKKKSLFQLHAEKIRARADRCHTTIPWYIMTSQTNDDETRQFFQTNGFFGLDPADVYFIIQQMVPAIDRRGKLILDAPDHLFMNPNGHGGSLKALWDSGAIKQMQERGIQTVFYFQVDNVLANICDPVYIGYHVLHQSNMSNKVVRKSYPEEKTGVLCLINGNLGLVEYSDLGKSEMYAMENNGQLKFWAGNTAIHLLEISFIIRLNEGGFHLPYHIAEKSIPYMDETGKMVQPRDKNGLKFETFVFDALPEARRTVSIEIDRAREFSVLKNKEGDNSPHTVHIDLNNFYGSWLENAGYTIKRGEKGDIKQNIEISPLFALDEKDLKTGQINFDAQAREIYIE